MNETQFKIIDRNHVLIMILLMLVVTILLVHPAQAQTITMANPSGIAERGIIVYWPNGSMQGYYNSTSVIILDNSSDYIFTQKPTRTNVFEDPGAWLTGEAFPFVQTNLTVLLAIGAILGIVFRKWLI